jgi:hypothetical protein
MNLGQSAFWSRQKTAANKNQQLGRGDGNANRFRMMIKSAAGKVGGAALEYCSPT